MGTVVLLALAVYLKGYFQWYADGAKYRDINANAQAYLAAQEKNQAALEAQYKNDPYGGATPEETLRLFIEALEKKDYTLASNYFIPEERAESLKKMPEGVQSGGFDALIKAYRTGRIQTAVNGDKSEIEVFSTSEPAPFFFQFVTNPFTNKWLISGL